MEEEQCRSCQYFRQHYTFDQRKIFRVYCGHCTFSRPKQKRPDAKACENYVAGTVKENSFVTKQYLIKELL